MTRSYYLHKRGAVYYAELVDKKTGLKLVARSTGERDRDAALLVVAGWLERGLPNPRLKKPRPVQAAFDLRGILDAVRRADLDSEGAMAVVSVLKERGLVDIGVVPKDAGAVRLAKALVDFWDYETSPFVKSTLGHGHTLGKSHCAVMQSMARRYWAPYWGDKAMREVTTDGLEAFGQHLRDTGLQSSTVNSILNSGTRAFAYWHKKGLLPENPGVGLERFSGGKKKRGVLTEAEAAALFARPWHDHVAKVASLIAATSGMRAGEVLALQARDIGETILEVRHSWSMTEGLKAPKNGEERRVPLLPEPRAALMALLRDNPHTDTPLGERFVFWGERSDAPRVDSGFMLDALHDELAKMGVDWRARNIVFHGWRHFYSARMAALESAEKVRRATGHKTASVFEEYAAHVAERDLLALRETAAQAFPWAAARAA
ncbi:MAG: tyrosine-type recombinase/integrase [Treponematales bacterium]